MKSPAPAPLVLTAVAAGGAGYFAATQPHSGPAAAAAAVASGERKIKFYQSPMHPWITSDRPGKCTICGMDLVPVYEGDAGFSTDGSVVTLAPASAAVRPIASQMPRHCHRARAHLSGLWHQS